MMSCHGCTENFGFLRKEYGCPNCKFSYCKKCLRFQVVDLKTSKPIMVCMKCSQTNEKRVKEPIDVMRALHRLESMDDPAKPPITVYRQPVTNRFQELKRGLSVEDQQILERLESLKKDDETDGRPQKSVRKSSEKVEEEIAERLARLKGEEYNKDDKSAASSFRNIKPQTEEDIIAKFTAEAELDNNYQSSVVSDIEERLAKLRGEPGGSSQSESSRSATKPDDLDELTEAEQIERIMKQLQEEVTLENKTCLGSTEKDLKDMDSADVTMHDSEDDDIDADELCGICGDKRAVLICKECDDDIFCKGCFKELHLDLGEMHAAKPFKLNK